MNIQISTPSVSTTAQILTSASESTTNHHRSILFICIYVILGFVCMMITILGLYTHTRIKRNRMRSGYLLLLDDLYNDKNAEKKSLLDTHYITTKSLSDEEDELFDIDYPEAPLCFFDSIKKAIDIPPIPSDEENI